MNTIEIKNLSKIYGTGHTAVKAVDNISLDIHQGEIVLFMGPSGSGKTTFLTMIGSLLKPTSGEILFDGNDVAKMSERDLPNFRLKNLGFVFQSFNLLSSLNALENVALPLIAAGLKRSEALSKAMKSLEKLELGHRLKNLPRDLSGGEKQRVSIARALVNDPKIILADEPTANLDSKIGQEVMKLFCSIGCKQGKSIIIVSHDERIKNVAHTVAYIEDGKLTRREKGNHNKVCTMREHSYVDTN